MATKHKAFLMFIAETNDKQTKVLLLNATKQQVHGLKEIVVNLLRGNVPLNSGQKKGLIRYKKFLRTFATKGVSRCTLGKNSKGIKLLATAVVPIINRI